MWSAGGAKYEFVAVVEDDESVGGVGGCGEDDTHRSGVYVFVCVCIFCLCLGFGSHLRSGEPVVLWRGIGVG